MKKLFYLLLLGAVVNLTSCESKSNPIDDVVGAYTYTESGVLSMGGNAQEVENSGTFVVHRVSDTMIRFSGDFIGTGHIKKDGSLYIEDDTDDFTRDGITYHLDNSYYNGSYTTHGTMRWEQRSEITAKYKSQTLSGTTHTYITAQKK